VLIERMNAELGADKVKELRTGGVPFPV